MSFIYLLSGKKKKKSCLSDKETKIVKRITECLFVKTKINKNKRKKYGNCNKLLHAAVTVMGSRNMCSILGVLHNLNQIFF